MNRPQFNTQLDKLKELVPIVKATNNKKLHDLFSFLLDRIQNPDSYVVMLGETSSGKSSLINGLIGQELLPVSAAPSTGTVVEVIFSEQGSEVTYEELTSDARLRELTPEEFKTLSQEPHEETLRLRATVPAGNGLMPGLRLFDTPGYGSIVDKHEEVLKDFLPNADAIIYTISYRVGFQKADCDFLKFARELLDHDQPFVLVINRCPNGRDVKEVAKRVADIEREVTDVLGNDKEPHVFVVPEVESNDEDEDAPVLPMNSDLWAYVGRTLNSEARREELAKAFDTYISDLADLCEANIAEKLLDAQSSEQELENRRRAKQEYAASIRATIPELINPTFNEIIKNIPGRIIMVREKVQAKVFDEIDKQDRTDKDETKAFVNAHLIPFGIQESSEELVNNYIDSVYKELNRKVDDLIQKETVRFNSRITIEMSTNTEAAVKKVLSGVAKKQAEQQLLAYAALYGGAGGTKAGIANAASHLLKKGGDLVGHTFTRATHNSLKSFLAKIGATSVKKLGGALTVVIEGVLTAYDLSTWKKKMKGEVEKALGKWQDDTIPVVVKDLKELRDQNAETVARVADKWEDASIDDTPSSTYDIQELQATADRITAFRKKFA